MFGDPLNCLTYDSWCIKSSEEAAEGTGCAILRAFIWLGRTGPVKEIFLCHLTLSFLQPCADLF